MKNKITGIVSLVMVVFFYSTISTGCYKDNEEELYGDVCDTTDISYSQDIVPLLDSYCYACHGDAVFSSLGGNIDLEGYSDLMVTVNSGQLVGAITHDPDFSPMPHGSPKLDDCSINTIKAWINQGALNN